MAKKRNFFIPYMRQGIATLSANADPTTKRMTVPIKVNLQAVGGGKGAILGADSVEKDIVLYGPGDIMGIDMNAVLKVKPAADSDNFAPSLSPFIEFSEPDLLWRFSTFQNPDGQWIPWLALIILKAEEGDIPGEFSKLKNENPDLPPRILINSRAQLPDLRESWRWAHIHLQELDSSSPEQVIEKVKRTPERAVCRLLCPRKLVPQTKYHAFLIPAYQIGMEAALGIGEGTEDRTLLSWENPSQATGKAMPYFFDWTFRTGTKGDFEYLVRKLKPRELENMGTRPIDCANPGYGMAANELIMDLEGALKSLDTEYQEWGMDRKDEINQPEEAQQSLVNLLNKREEIIDGEIKLRVTPPVYGEWYAGMEGKPLNVEQTNKKRWIEELNLDFRHRAAAGFGVRFIKENQEGLMKAAWEQMNKVKKVNRQLNLGRFGRQLSQTMYKRMGKMSSESLLKSAMPLQYKVTMDEGAADSKSRSLSPLATVNVGSRLRNSMVTNNLGQLKIKKFLPQKRNGEKGTEAQTFTPIEGAQLVSPGFKPKGMVNKWSNATDSAYETSKENKTSQNLFTDMGAQFRTALNPINTIEKKLSSRINSLRLHEKLYRQEGNSIKNNTGRQRVPDPLRPVLWHPEFHRPMYRFLRDLSQDHILPGLEAVEQNTIGLLQTNRRFIEAFMLGLNHEFAAELRWREFPTDMRGSYFRSFWDTSIYSLDGTEKGQFRETSIGKDLLQDLTQKHGTLFNTFPKIEAAYANGAPTELEKEVGDAYEAVVEEWLLTRDEDKDIDHIANWKNKSRLGDHPVPGKFNNAEEDQNQMVLLIRGELLLKFGNTLIYLVERRTDEPGRPNLTKGAKRIFPVFEGAFPPDMVFVGFPVTEAQVADYFVIFEERMTDLRFGLDISDTTDTALLQEMGEKDLSWQHFPDASDEGYLDGHQPLILETQWNNAAFIGRAMVQKQVRVAVELGRLVPGSG